MEKCERAKTISYGLTLKPGTKLMLAVIPEAKWLLQGELLAIKIGLRFQ